MPNSEASRNVFNEGTQRCPTHIRHADRAEPTTEDTPALPARLCAERVMDLQHGKFETDTDIARDIDPKDRKGLSLI